MPPGDPGGILIVIQQKNAPGIWPGAFFALSFELSAYMA
jgi:hypothetical protein